MTTEIDTSQNKQHDLIDFLKIALKIGYKPTEFWDLTPIEFELAIDVFNENQQTEQENRLTQAYLTAYWQRVKDMPKLQDIINKKEKKPTSPESMLNMVKALNEAFQGTTY